MASLSELKGQGKIVIRQKKVNLLLACCKSKTLHCIYNLKRGIFNHVITF